jgi:hypothetical protein
MRAIGFDPSPSRGAHVCDGGGAPKLLSAQAMASFLESLPEDVLIGYDGPLSGPIAPDDPNLRQADLSRRVIEAFFKSPEDGFAVPAAIALAGYAAQPHWPLTRRMFGLPRLGRLDRPVEELPFQPVLEAAQAPESGRHVVEVNAQVAIFLVALEDPAFGSVNWGYRDRPDVLKAIWRIVIERLTGRSTGELAEFWKLPPPDNMQQFEAIVAWLMTSLWVTQDSQIELLGNARTGAWLVPKIDGLNQAFQGYAARELGRRALATG